MIASPLGDAPVWQAACQHLQKSFDRSDNSLADRSTYTKNRDLRDHGA
jgi:hypothetical protein